VAGSYEHSSSTNSRNFLTNCGTTKFSTRTLPPRSNIISYSGRLTEFKSIRRRCRYFHIHWILILIHFMLNITYLSQSAELTACVDGVSHKKNWKFIM
jgi:hypothetical protein